MPPTPTRITGLSEIAGRYDAILCDVWGVLHDGLRPHAGVVEALTRFRARGPVVLVTNAPRPSGAVVDQLAGLGIAGGWDAIVSSGDVVRQHLRDEGFATARHIGHPRDLGLYEDTPIALLGRGVRPDVVVLAGLVDDTTETPADYRDEVEEIAAMDVPVVCANPDVVVERGDTLVWCAGAIAEMIEGLGRPVRQFGKPHPPIYAAALAAVRRLKPDAARVLVVGDGLPTDIRGAHNEGLDSLFVTDGIHAADFGGPGAPDDCEVPPRLAAEGLSVPWFAPRLVW